MKAGVQPVMRNLLLGASCLIPTPCRAGDEWRKFTDISGRQMVAKVVRVEADVVVVELKSSGEQVGAISSNCTKHRPIQHTPLRRELRPNPRNP